MPPVNQVQARPFMKEIDSPYHNMVPIVDWHTDELPGGVWRQRRRWSRESVSEAGWPPVRSTSIVCARDRLRLTTPHAGVPRGVFSWKKKINEQKQLLDTVPYTHRKMEGMLITNLELVLSLL